MAAYACDDCEAEGVRLTTGGDGRDRCDRCLDKWESGPQNDDWLASYYGGSGAQTDDERHRVAAAFKQALRR